MARILHAVLVMLIVAALGSCGGGGEGADPQSARALAPQGAGSIRLALTDTSACGFEHVWITVDRIRVYPRSPAAKVDTVATDVELSPPRRIDLLALTGGVLEELGAASLPAGHYEALRLVLVANGPEGAADSLANAVQAAGSSPMPLATPSAVQSGLKVPLNLDVASGEMADVVLDFDACKSVVSAGNSGRFVLKPVLTARPRTVQKGDFVAAAAQLVNTTTAGDQVNPRIAVLDSGGFVVGWTSGADSFAQRFDATGARIAGETRIASSASLTGIARTGAGGFAAGLQRYGPVSPFGQQDESVLFQRFDGAGVPAGDLVTVDSFVRTGIPFLSGGPVLSLADGGFLVSADHDDPTPPVGSINTTLRRFTASGAPVGAALTAGSPTSSEPVVTVLANGNVVATWDQIHGNFNREVAWQLQTIDGQTLATGVEDQGDVFTSSNGYPAAAPLAGGGFVLVWFHTPTTTPGAPPDGVPAGWVMQIFDANGQSANAPVALGGPAFASPGSQAAIHLTALADGGLLAWQKQGGVTVAEYFSASVSASGRILQIAGPVSDVAATADGGFVVTMQLQGAATGQDVWVQKFTPSVAAAAGAAR